MRVQEPHWLTSLLCSFSHELSLSTFISTQQKEGYTVYVVETTNTYQPLEAVLFGSFCCRVHTTLAALIDDSALCLKFQPLNVRSKPKWKGLNIHAQAQWLSRAGLLLTCNL